MFTKAIVRQPATSMVKGISSANLGKPDHQTALIQHQAYIHALEKCGLDVTVLEPEDLYPDSTFVEDAALLTRRCAIITRPGAETRRGEIDSIRHAVSRFYPDIESIMEPGTLDAGDVMMVKDHFYIGLSQRTNLEGANQLIAILKKYGLSGSTIPMKKVLHLKTGLAYLENNNLLITGEFLRESAFRTFNQIAVPSYESYAANCVWINGYVLVPDGFPETREKISKAGYPTLCVDVSEFRKLDGGLSCLSLRF